MPMTVRSIAGSPFAAGVHRCSRWVRAAARTSQPHVLGRRGAALHVQAVGDHDYRGVLAGHERERHAGKSGVAEGRVDGGDPHTQAERLRRVGAGRQERGHGRRAVARSVEAGTRPAAKRNRSAAVVNRPACPDTPPKAWYAFPSFTSPTRTCACASGRTRSTAPDRIRPAGADHLPLDPVAGRTRGDRAAGNRCREAGLTSPNREAPVPSTAEREVAARRAATTSPSSMKPRSE